MVRGLAVDLMGWATAIFPPVAVQNMMGWLAGAGWQRVALPVGGRGHSGASYRVRLLCSGCDSACTRCVDRAENSLPANRCYLGHVQVS